MFKTIVGNLDLRSVRMECLRVKSGVKRPFYQRHRREQPSVLGSKFDSTCKRCLPPTCKPHNHSRAAHGLSPVVGPPGPTAMRSPTLQEPLRLPLARASPLAPRLSQESCIPLDDPPHPWWPIPALSPRLIQPSNFRFPQTEEPTPSEECSVSECSGQGTSGEQASNGAVHGSNSRLVHGSTSRLVGHHIGELTMSRRGLLRVGCCGCYSCLMLLAQRPSASLALVAPVSALPASSWYDGFFAWSMQVGGM